MTRTNDEIFRIIDELALEADRVAARGDGPEASVARRRLQDLVHEHWERIRRLVEVEHNRVNVQLQARNVKLRFQEQEEPQKPRKDWKLYFASRSLHLKARPSLLFVPRDDATFEMRVRTDDAAPEQGSTREMRDFTPEEAKEVVNRLLNMAFTP